jgi:hypothetical protein
MNQFVAKSAGGGSKRTPSRAKIRGKSRPRPPCFVGAGGGGASSPERGAELSAVAETTEATP